MSFNKIENNQPINLAFLGCGKITKSHSKTIKKYKDVNRYYASRTQQKAASYSKELGGKGYFDSYEKAINSTEINTVFICTPPDSHLDLALKAIRAGKHVIIEKPPFFKASDFDLIAKERAKTGVQVMVAENYFYKPLLIKLREILKTDVIGQPKFLYFNATKTQKNEDWRNEKSLVGGGALFEGGIHWVNFISNMGMKVSSVHGFRPDKSNEQLERSMQVVFKFEEGAIGNLLYSWEVNTLFFGLRLSKIFGTKGSITLESNGLFIFVRGKKWRFILPGFSDIVGKKAMFKDFFKALRTGEEPEFNLALAKRDLTFIEKAYEGN